MNTIRTILASLALLCAFAAPAHADAQTAPLRYTLQNDPQIPDTTTRQQQDEVMRLVGAHLGLRLSGNPAAYPYEQIVTEDAVFEYPYAEADSSRRIEGRAAVAKAQRDCSENATRWEFNDVKLFQTPHPDVFFVSYTATAYSATAKQTYQQRYLARVTVRDGKIANYYELWDRDAEAVAGLHHTARN